MSYLRRISSRRLVALILGFVLATGVGAAAIALAAGGSGTTPPPKALADAIHDALAAPKPAGVTARIEFTNHLVDAASLQGSDPLMAGAKGRLWASGDKLRLELQAAEPGGGAGDVQVLLDRDRMTVIDTGANTVYRLTLPQNAKDRSGPPPGQEPVPSVARIQQALAMLAGNAHVSGARPDDVAGRPAYTVRLAPAQSGGLLGAAELAWDAEHGVPLRAAVFARGSGTPVLELRTTDVSFGRVADADLSVPAPAGAKVVDLSAANGPDHQARTSVTGLDAVQARVPFRIAAPDQLAGRKRQAVRLVDQGRTPGALVTYGEGLGAIAVLQTAAESGKGASPAPDGGLSLPRVSIGGASAEELDTALGTVLRFERGGVAYTIAGSVPPAAAVAAARAL